MCVGPAVLESPVSLASSISSGAYNLSAPSSEELPEPRGERLDEDIPFRAMSQGQSLHILCLCLPLFPPATRGIFSDDG